MDYVRRFATLGLQDIALVGGKNASLGQMIQDLKNKNIAVPDGFAITAKAYWLHIQENNLQATLYKTLKPLKKGVSLQTIQRAGKKARDLIKKAPLPKVLQNQIIQAYQEFCEHLGCKNVSVAVRS